MRRSGIWVCTLVLIFVFAGFVLADEMGSGLEKNIDGLKVTLSFMSEPVKTGETQVMVKLHDAQGKPVIAAKVKVTPSMDAKEDMDEHAMKDAEPEMVRLKPSHEKGQYMGMVNLSDPGKWVIKVNLTAGNAVHETDFIVNVAKRGPNWWVIGGFLGLISLIVIVASILKKSTTVKH